VEEKKEEHKILEPGGFPIGFNVGATGAYAPGSLFLTQAKKRGIIYTVNKEGEVQ
jgi:hypothetical protein